MTGNFKVEKFGDRNICIGGVGVLFHREGFPLGMSAKKLAEGGIELSWFHVIKELYHQYTSNDRLYTKIAAEIEDAAIDVITVDLEEIRRFIYADYDTQQEMTFKYLFGCSSGDIVKDGRVRETINPFPQAPAGSTGNIEDKPGGKD